MKCLLPLAALIGLSGCAVSLQPFYSRDVILDDRSIEGRWTDGKDTWQVTRVAPGRFEIGDCNSNGLECKADIVGVLFRSVDGLFLDFTDKPDTAFSTAFRLHGLLQLRIASTPGGAIDVTMLDSDRVARLAEHHTLDTEFADTDTGAVLTARPENLRKFVGRHLNDGQLFGETHHLRRP